MEDDDDLLEAMLKSNSDEEENLKLEAEMLAMADEEDYVVNNGDELDFSQPIVHNEPKKRVEVLTPYDKELRRRKLEAERRRLLAEEAAYFKENESKGISNLASVRIRPDLLMDSYSNEEGKSILDEAFVKVYIPRVFLK